MKKYWWVNHKQTHRQEISGGYLWSPKQEKNGAKSQFYENMRLASPGDIVLSFANSEIAFIGIVKDFALAGSKPEEFGLTGEYWSTEGWLLPVKWQKLVVPVKPKTILNRLSAILPKKYSPIHPETGNGNQKAYLAEIDYQIYEIITEIGKFDFQQLNSDLVTVDTFREYIDRLDQIVERSVIENKVLSITEKDTLIKARRGQGVFRENVQQREPRCRITGISNHKFLIASHIKPWRSCVSANERLDGNNGLLLTPNVDLLFDRGLITFQDDRKVLVSSKLNQMELSGLGLARCLEKSTGKFSSEQCIYLSYHRSSVFIC